MPRSQGWRTSVASVLPILAVAMPQAAQASKHGTHHERYQPPPDPLALALVAEKERPDDQDQQNQGEEEDVPQGREEQSDDQPGGESQHPRQQGSNGSRRSPSLHSPHLDAGESAACRRERRTPHLSAHRIRTSRQVKQPRCHSKGRCHRGRYRGGDPRDIADFNALPSAAFQVSWFSGGERARGDQAIRYRAPSFCATGSSGRCRGSPQPPRGCRSGRRRGECAPPRAP